MSSRTYQLSSQTNEGSQSLDTGNNYLWRHYRQRLSAEEIRDSLLYLRVDLAFKANYNTFLTNLPLKRVSCSFIKMPDIPVRIVYMLISRLEPNEFLKPFNFSDGNLSIDKQF